jgi:predicted nucleic acid-binding protein
MRIYLDSSALAKRYIKEPGSERVLQICSEASEIYLSILSIPELISAFNRLKREGKLQPKVYQQLKKEMSKDVNEASVIPLNHNILRRSIRCLEQSRVKTLDALHIATASETTCKLFVSADLQQCRAAEKMNLVAERI